ncbi:MAG: deoxyribodipyrimidine photo-lyase [Chitinophagaceae bacterium]|nr:deoxyribodipyrimidine photo-lyase [Chitinophagaceae bacterium]
MEKINVFWFRRDLRLQDNAGLYKALTAGQKVQPLFIFDKNILNELPSSDRRVDFIHQALRNIHKQLADVQAGLQIEYGDPKEVFASLIRDERLHAVYTNHDYEPYAIQRDLEIAELLKDNQIPFYSFKDQVIFEKNDVVKDDGRPYTVFTPYSKKWKAILNDQHLHTFPTDQYFGNFVKSDPKMTFPGLEQLGFEKTDLQFMVPQTDTRIIQNYHLNRDIPSVAGTTRMGIHLRFGTISVRQLTRVALQNNEKYLNELIWREFYQSLLWHFPHVVSKAFKPAYDKIQWRNNEAEFEKWCNGLTGYPIVDAGMRELNETGWMHNRVRMVVASFLTKHLLIDWRWGEAYFAEKLLDFDLASNNGGWQWAAGSGADAAPYFRIFNPTLQTLKFDKDLEYIRKWVPEFESFEYPPPMVDHAMARERCLQAFKIALKEES